jgi:hypothetical protein
MFVYRYLSNVLGQEYKLSVVEISCGQPTRGDPSAWSLVGGGLASPNRKISTCYMAHRNWRALVITVTNLRVP